MEKEKKRNISNYIIKPSFVLCGCLLVVYK